MLNHVFEASLDGFSLDIRLSELAAPHYYLTESGRLYSTFIYILSGNIELNSGELTVTARTGDFFTIPARRYCRAVWTEDRLPGIVRFYSIHLAESPAHAFSGSFAMMKLPEFSNPETLSRVEKIYTLMQGSELERLRALGKFIDFWCDLKPLLSFSPRKTLSKPLIEALAILESDYTLDMSIAALAKRVHVSETQLYSFFRSELAQTPVTYRNRLRVSAAMRMLETTDLPIAEVAERTGFSSLVHFRNVFREATGTTPGKFRKNGGM